MENFDIAVFAHKRAAETIEAATSLTRHEAQHLAATCLFYRLQADIQARIYHAVAAEFEPGIEPYDNDLELADQEAMKIALDEAKNGHFQPVKQYLQGLEDNCPPGKKDQPFSGNMAKILSLVGDTGEPFHEPKLPHQDTEITQAYKEQKMSKVPPELIKALEI